jgi:hypothetical protein
MKKKEKHEKTNSEMKKKELKAISVEKRLTAMVLL